MRPSVARTCRACLAAVSPTPYLAMIAFREGTRAPGFDKALPRRLDVGDAELPGQHLVRAAAVKPFAAFNAEFDRTVTERGEIRVLGALVGHVEAQPDVEVTFGRKIADE